MQVSKHNRPFKGKIAFISGGSRGIGLAIAENLAERGAHIVFSYLRSRADAVKAEKRLTFFRTRVLAIRANMGNEEHIQNIFQMIQKEFGTLNFIIHNAASGVLKPVLDLTDEEWQRSLEVNLRALFLCAKLGVPLMKGRCGKIVSISSQGSRRVLSNYSAVGVAKAAMESLTRYLAVELAPIGININVVMAGTTDTQSLRTIPRYEQIIRLAKSKTPAGRIGSPEDIANVVSFLCSEESNWIVGQTIIADGGYSLIA